MSSSSIDSSKLVILDAANFNSPPPTSKNYAIITHNNTLQCFFEKIKNKTGVKTRFQNCAILRLTLYLKGENKGKYELKLVYDGELSDKEQIKVSQNRPYYTKESITNNGYTYFTPIQGQITNDNKEFNLLPSDLENLYTELKLNVDKINFYIERHGQAQHNEKKWNTLSRYGLQLDTSITDEGLKQATNAAQALAEILGDKHIDTVFVSDLQRTRQTALALFNNRTINLDNNKIVALPCANELDTSGDGNGNCYEKSAKSLKPFRARENYSACNIQNLQSDGECSQITLSSSEKIVIDWSLYSAFYEGKMRGYPNLKDIPNCGQTNMVSMAVYYLLNSNSNSIGGSKTRKRKHKMKCRIKNKMKTKKTTKKTTKKV